MMIKMIKRNNISIKYNIKIIKPKNKTNYINNIIKRKNIKQLVKKMSPKTKPFIYINKMLMNKNKILITR